MDVGADGGDILPCSGLLYTWVGDARGSSLLGSGVDHQDWDKIGRSEDEEVSATVLREEQGEALLAQFCRQSLPLYLSESPANSEIDLKQSWLCGFFGGVCSGNKDMDYTDATNW